jgi:hypothetical protein
MTKNELKQLIRECISELRENIQDPTKEELLSHLKKSFGNEEDFEYSAEAAIYWFANHYHGGQTSNLYSVLSHSNFRPGPVRNEPEKGSLEEMMYDELVYKFGNNETLKEVSKTESLSSRIKNIINNTRTKSVKLSNRKYGNKTYLQIRIPGLFGTGMNADPRLDDDFHSVVEKISELGLELVETDEDNVGKYALFTSPKKSMKEISTSAAAGGQEGGTIKVPTWVSKKKFGSPGAVKGSKSLGYKVVKDISEEMTNDIWIMWGDSESGDHYKKVKYDHEPTDEDKKNYIKKYTPEDMDIDGPGDFGSYVYLEVEKI